MSLALPVGKIQSIKSSARKLLRTKGTISIRQLSRFIGLCTSAKYAVPQATLHYRPLQFLRNSVLKGRRYSPTLYNLEVHLSPKAITDLKWWADQLQYHNKTPICINNPDLIITSDASDLGWGAWCGKKSVQGLWSQEEMFWHINPRELQAAYLALKIFSPPQINQLFHIQLQIDNQAAVSYINHLGGTHSKLLCQLSLDLWNWSLSRQIHISARYIPGISNKHADHMSRRLRLTAEWKLNPILFQRIVAVYGMPQIDLFATRVNTQLRMFVSWIPDPQSAAIDAFSVQWSDPLSYVFPPFSLIMRCVQRIKKSERESFASNPSMEIQTLVPPPVFSPLRSTPTSSEFRDYTTSPIQPEGLEAPTEYKQVDSSRLAAVRQCFSKYQVSERVSKIIFASWRSGTESQYKSCWGKWHSWCMEREINPVSCNLNFVLEFLTDLFYQNYQYRTINVCMSTISASHLPIDGSPIGSHPLISHFMKGIFELRPPQHRLFTIWSVMTVLKYLKSLSPPEDLNLKQLTLKVVTLSALVSAARCSFLHQVDLNFSYFRNDGYVFLVPGLVKGSKPHKPHLEIFLPLFPPDASLCVPSYLKRYIDVTSSKRNNSSSRNFLFISYVKPHKAVKTSSISRWLKNVLRLSGIDTSQFSAHSTRSASSTLAANCGVSISDIMKVADRSRAGTLKKFYQRPILDSYAHRILSSASSVGNPQSHDGENEVDRG